MEHLAQMAAIAREVGAIKRMAQPKQQLSGAADDDADHAYTMVAGEALPQTEDDLWDEDKESMELLKEMAGWDKQVEELRAIARKGLEQQSEQKDC